ncbi:hypothetical protein DFJ73DRAFT_958317 [Zopfochytrium polystomum]|nr:hypothetical protein DFJ73DRAFT_958317 [Zopfochytrium polystomum]
MNGPATNLFLECRDLLERSLESDDQDSNFSKDSPTALDQARWKWISEEFIPWLANDSETQKQLKDIHDRGQKLTLSVFAQCLEEAATSHSEFQKMVESIFSISFPKLKPCPKSRPALRDDEKQSTAFHQDFLDPHGYIPRLRKDLEESAKGWRTKSYYYPGVTLVQRSGSGKSRAVAQLASRISKDKDGLQVVYCSFMQPGSTGYPNRSKIADKLVLCQDESEFKYYFAACFEAVMEDRNTRDRFWKTHTVNLNLEQKAVQSFANKSRAFVISMDTKARMPEVAPVNRVDAAERLSVAGEDQKRNFRPLFLFGSVDIGLLSSYGLNDTDAFSPKQYLSHGRILWRALMDASFPIQKVRELAVSKLAGGGKVSFDSTPKITATMAASFIRARVSYLVYQSELSSELIASNMWWCMSISEERDHIVAGMPSEPILADAAALWMHNAENRLEILKLFSYLSSRSAVDVGHSGEIVAQLLLILGRDAAVWKACKNLSNETKSELAKNRNPQEICRLIVYYGLIGLKEFLESTLQASAASDLRRESKARSHYANLPDPMAVGKVSFTHFVQLFDSVTDMAVLALLFARGAAVWCRVGTVGVDLIIPVLMPDRNNEYVIHADNMTYVLVRVKNNADCAKDKNFQHSATAGNSALSCDLDTVPRHMYLSLFLSFGGKTANVEILEPMRDLPNLKAKLPPSSTLFNYVIPKDGPHSEIYSNLRKTLCEEIAEQQREEELGGKRAGKRKRDPSPDNSKLADDISATEVARRFRQLSIAVLGFSQDLYPCITPATSSPENAPGLSDEIFQHLKKLLQSPHNPVQGANDPKEAEILKRMVYPSSLDMLRASEDAVFKNGATGARRDEIFDGTMILEWTFACLRWTCILGNGAIAKVLASFVVSIVNDEWHANVPSITTLRKEDKHVEQTNVEQ